MAAAKKPATGAIRFVRDFDHVEVGKTTAYRVGHVVEKPTQALRDAASDRAEPHAPEQQKSDGE